MILPIWVVLAMIVICQAKGFASGFRRARDDLAYRACEAQAVRNSLGKVLPFRRCNCAEGRAKTNFCVISLHLVFDEIGRASCRERLVIAGGLAAWELAW